MAEGQGGRFQCVQCDGHYLESENAEGSCKVNAFNKQNRF